LFAFARLLPQIRNIPMLQPRSSLSPLFPRPRTAEVRALRGGFTLIELLTVIAILAILGAILIPVTAQVRASARQAQCASNMRQIGLALRLYADDHNGFLPAIAHQQRPEDAWIFTLAPYLGNVNEIRISPSDPRAEEMRRFDWSTSYLMNDIIFLPTLNEFGQTEGPDWRNLDSLQSPSRTKLAFIGSDRRGVAPNEDHTHARRWAGNWTAVVRDIAPDRHRAGSESPDRTNGSANYLYADGHVESIAAAKIRALIDAGVNIAMPPEAR
jgi:prepilin-type N-terminal cleavage/methylation domain-containing protein/prepilin-type processing-associated H-X9-DG protein